MVKQKEVVAHAELVGEGPTSLHTHPGVIRMIQNPTTDHSAEGDGETVIVGESVSIGDILYGKSDGKFWKADASSDSTSKGRLVMATESLSTDQSGTVLLYGKLRDDSWSWTPGDILYVSPTPGGPTTTLPSGTGEIVRIIGHTHTANMVFFNPEQSYLEIS